MSEILPFDNKKQFNRQYSGFIAAVKAEQDKKRFNRDGTVNNIGKPDDILSAINDVQKKEYQDNYRALNKQMMDTVNSTTLVDEARVDADRFFDQAEGRGERMAGRYGINYTPFERAEVTRRGEAARGLNYDHMINMARRHQYERNTLVRDNLLAVSDGLQTSTLGQLETAATLQMQREHANRQIAAQNQAARFGMIGDLLETAFAAYLFKKKK